MTEVENTIPRIFSPEIDYKSKTISHGKTIFNKRFQKTGGTTVNITSSTSSATEFEIPTDVINLSKSRLSYTLTPKASEANLSNAIFSDTIPEIRSIEFYDSSGVFLVKIEDVNKYLKGVLRHETPLDEMLANDIPFSGIAGGQTSGGIWEGLHQIELFGNKIPESAGTSTPYKEPSPAYYIGGNYANATKAARAQDSATPIIHRNFP